MMRSCLNFYNKQFYCLVYNGLVHLSLLSTRQHINVFKFEIGAIKYPVFNFMTGPRYNLNAFLTPILNVLNHVKDVQLS